MRSRSIAFAALAGICVVAAIVSGAIAVVGNKKTVEKGNKAVAAARPNAERVIGGGEPFVAFRTLDRTNPANYGRFAVAPLTAEGPGKAVLAGPVCERVTFRASTGMCLARAGATTFPAIQLDQDMKEVHRYTIAGVPSRTRISPDGRYAGITAFLTGHSYAQPGQFSTAATIIDLKAGKVVGDLEKDFKVFNDGKLIDERDRNFWGLTFAGDGDTFYATVATGTENTWLIKGSIKAKRAETIHANVECPSLSPDGTRIGYKKAVGHGPTVWRFTVLDLKTGKETPTAETRPIDDQVEWLDDQHLLYRDGETTWIVNADGSGEPRLWMKASDSPAVVRP
ncbi:hypothetical protein [Solirubrobacter soli]|uniref:hypothetical protein n=1 Tax=Solirubrobacter soli TaxID=363832 RepID=UPI000428EBF4|nr:hypothetical protein [Solirubrobacter soli]